MNIPPYERKVYYYETDKMGIMHHSNYVRIFEESRIDFIAKAGIPYEKIEASGLMMPVLSIDCTYKHPLRFGEPFAVYIYITKFNGVGVDLSYKIISRETGELCAEGSSKHCFTDHNLRPVRTRTKYPEIYETFAEVVTDDTET